MSDSEDIVWESLFSPGKRKRKKKGKQNSKNKNTSTMKIKDNTPKKKKKKSKFKEAMEERKANKKEKKKKKKKEKLSAKLPDKIVNEHSASNFVAKTQFAKQLTPENLTQLFNEKSKPKKQVAFDLPHGHIRIKRPKLQSSSLTPRPTRESTSPMTGVMGNTAVTEPNQYQAKTNDSQSTSDDMLSQDLFITQKTFRVPLSQMSSEEASDKAEDAAKVAQVYHKEIKQEETLCCLFQTQQSKTKISNEKSCFSPIRKAQKELCQEMIKCSPTNTYMDVPIVVSSLPDGEKIGKDYIVLSQLSHSSQQQMSKTKSSFTQTENFFSTELTLYLSFCQKRKRNTEAEEFKPLDLSLPNRARRDLSSCVDTKDLQEETNQRGNLTEVSRHGQHPWSVRALGKDPSPQSESEPKFASTSTSGEDNDAPGRISRLDLMQMKGEGSLPRPESPLMKQAQGRKVKSRKSH